MARRNSYPGQVVTAEWFGAVITIPTVYLASKFEVYVQKKANVPLRYLDNNCGAVYATRDGCEILIECGDRAMFDAIVKFANNKGWVVE